MNIMDNKELLATAEALLKKGLQAEFADDAETAYRAVVAASTLVIARAAAFWQEQVQKRVDMIQRLQNLVECNVATESGIRPVTGSDADTPYWTCGRCGSVNPIGDKACRNCTVVPATKGPG